MEGRARVFLVGVVIFAVLGAAFAAVSSYDYILHLDRQVHAVNCSFIPGVGKLDETGASGCYAVMMSPYSSVLRDATWGGIPIALPGFAVFAYLLFIALYLLIASDAYDRHAARYLVAATLLPVGTSIWYYYIAAYKVGAVCKLCVGIYAASAGVLLFAVLGHLAVRGTRTGDDAVPWGRYALHLAEGLLFVAVPLLLYLQAKPALADAQMQCGTLMSPEDKYGIMVRVNPVPGGRRAIEVIDPLCPACAAFAERLTYTDHLKKLDIAGVLFPLDRECNWMIPQTMHPGACAIAEALLCAKDARAKDVLAWAYGKNEEIRTRTQGDPQYAYTAVKQAFPELAGCVGAPEVKSRLNKALRWSVANALPVVTPQLYVDGRRLCEEDTDLGLEFALGRLTSAPAAAPAAAEKPAPAQKRGRK